MFKIIKKEIEIAGKKISLETGKIARQADGAIIATCGETVVLATAVGAKKINPDAWIDEDGMDNGTTQFFTALDPYYIEQSYGKFGQDYSGR